MKRIVSALLTLLLLAACSSEGDPYLNLDEELIIEFRSLVVPDNYELLADETRRYGAEFQMYQIDFIEGGNVAEVSVRFLGGCAEHRFALYANSTYEDVASFDQPLDVTLYLYHSHDQEDCFELQDHVLRRVDLSFLHPGRYNLTIQSAFDRTSFRVLDYEIK